MFDPMLMLVKAEFNINFFYHEKLGALKKILQFENCIYKTEFWTAKQLIGSNVKLSL